MGYPDPDGSYNAYSFPIIDTDKKIGWLLSVNYIDAVSSNDAIKQGQKIVSNVNTQLNQFPYKYNFMGAISIFCVYDNNVTLFGIVSDGPVINHSS
jgi:hypothetical protein